LIKGVDAPNWKLGIETLGLRYDIYKLSFLLSNYGNESPLKLNALILLEFLNCNDGG
jgi:hypothetical protein